MKFNAIEVISLLLVYVIVVAIYFVLSDRGKNPIVIPSHEELRQFNKYTKVKLDEISLNFDDSTKRINAERLSNEIHKSEPSSNHLISNVEFSEGVEIRMRELDQYYFLNSIDINYWCYAEKQLEGVVAVLNITDSSGVNVDWQGVKIIHPTGEWNNGSLTFNILPKYLDPDNIIKLFFWNRSKEEFYLDDIGVQFWGEVISDKINFNNPLTRTIQEKFELQNDSVSPNYNKDNSHSGNYSYNLTNIHEYSPAITKSIGEISVDGIGLVTLGAWFYPLEPDFELLLVATIRKSDGTEYVWEGRSTDKGNYKMNEWSKHRAQFKLPSEKISQSDIISVYIWNKGKTNILIDDLEVVYGEQQSRIGGDPVFDTEQSEFAAFEFVKNQRPFQIGYLQSSGEFLFDSIFLDNIKPESLLSYGNFIKGSNLTQILIVDNVSLNVYGFCKSLNKLSLIYSGTLSMELPARNLVSGDLDGDRLDDIMIIDSEGEASIFSLSDKKGGCGFKSSFEKIQSLGTKIKIGDKSEVFDCLLIDKNHDKKYEFLINNLTKNKISILYAESDKLFYEEIKFRDENTNVEKLLIWDDERFTGSDKLYCLTVADGVENVSCFKYNPEMNQFYSSDVGSFIPYEYLNKSSHFLYSNRLSIREKKVLLFNNNWRFELNAIDFSNDSFGITEILELSSSNKFNKPKYYENNILLLGSFISMERTELITISFDCLDLMNNGSSCKEFESNPVVGHYVVSEYNMNK